jgi:hypothetical protein
VTGYGKHAGVTRERKPRDSRRDGAHSPPEEQP